ncbi:hypothetical protein FEP82_05696 [Burkholderia multivorans]|nr:hypothetical protein [Burkholderia multivorans]MDR8827466.1 hypothetical protein [Burkholderia multivorans]
MPTVLNVQFVDSSESSISTYFGSPQDPSVYPNLGTVDTGDPRWEEFYNSAGGAITGLPAPTPE